MSKADDMAVGKLDDDEQRCLIKLLEGVRAVHGAGALSIDVALTGHRPSTAPSN